MNDLKILNPFSNILSPKTFDGFIGREWELSALSDAFRQGAPGVLIIGSGGVGKTSLARVFASLSGEQFPGGIFFASASQAENPEHLLARVLPKHLNDNGLLVLDDLESLEEADLVVLLDAVNRYPALRLILISRRLLPGLDGFLTIALQGMNRKEFQELLRLQNALEHDRPNEQLAERLFAVAEGNPLFASVATAAIRGGTVTSWQDLLENLGNFQSTGLIGPDGVSLSTDSGEYKQVVFDASSTNSKILEMLQHEPELAWKLPSRKFEEIVAEILCKQGYEIVITPPSRDGGFDMYAARKEGIGKFLYLVECKRYVPPNKVGIEIVRSLYGVVQTKRATAGAIVTTSFFTSGAEAFRREVQHQLHLHDYIALQKWIKDFPLDGGQPTR